MKAGRSLTMAAFAALFLLLAGCQRAADTPAPAKAADAAAAAVGDAAAPTGAPATASTATPADVARRAIERRAAEAAIWGMPAVNYDLMRQQMLTKTAGKENQVIYWGRPLDWHNQTLTPNPDTIYFMAFIDTKDAGPMVVEVPPAGPDGSLNGNFVNVWQAPLEDAGLLGVDKGKGVKLVFLPPGFEGKVPAGFEALQPGTYGGYALLRSNLKSHSPEDVARSVNYAKRIRVYPLSQAANPPDTVFTDVQNVDFDSTIRYDDTFFDNLNRVVQAEPWLDRDRAMIDMLATLGIAKGKPYEPTAETRQALAAGAREAQQYLAERYDAGMPEFYEGTHWMLPAHPDLVKAAQVGFNAPDEYPVDARGTTYTYGYIGIKRLGAGQFYSIAIKDKDGRELDGGRTYRLHVPPNVPVEQYWSVTAYDRQTHALIRNMDRASRASNSSELQKNSDGSVDIFFGPKAPAGKESNWVPTDPQRGFEVMFRAYGPTKAFFEKQWRLPGLEPL